MFKFNFVRSLLFALHPGIFQISTLIITDRVQYDTLRIAFFKLQLYFSDWLYLFEYSVQILTKRRKTSIARKFSDPDWKKTHFVLSFVLYENIMSCLFLHLESQICKKLLLSYWIRMAVLSHFVKFVRIWFEISDIRM